VSTALSGGTTCPVPGASWRTSGRRASGRRAYDARPSKSTFHNAASFELELGLPETPRVFNLVVVVGQMLLVDRLL
jgi:hypothetical protein